jgi:hypothetical protein
MYLGSTTRLPTRTGSTPTAAGKLKPGWFGGIDRNGAMIGFDPATGQPTAYDGDLQAKAACAAVAYPIARGDLSARQDFSRMDITGITDA